MSEAVVTINDEQLTEGQVITLRVAMTEFVTHMAKQDVLGSDEHGEKLRKLYLERGNEVLGKLING